MEMLEDSSVDTYIYYIYICLHISISLYIYIITPLVWKKRHASLMEKLEDSPVDTYIYLHIYMLKYIDFFIYISSHL